MIEMRWVYHDMAKGAPKMGCINSGSDQHVIWMKLQYRHRPYLPPMHDMGDGVLIETIWSEWQDVAPPSVTV